jgi:hemerythrin-like metal-binding protein
MNALEWSDDFVLDLPHMDDTHREFVELLAAARSATDTELLAAWDKLVDHTDDHFSREDRWMTETRFSASNCHTVQHGVVLQIMRQGAERGRTGELAMIRQLTNELAVWFPQHAQTMDTALATHLKWVGFDPSTGLVNKPHALPVDEIHGCAGESCSDTPSQTEAMA